MSDKIDAMLEDLEDSDDHFADVSHNMRSMDYVKIGKDLCQAMEHHEGQMNAQKYAMSTSSVDVQENDRPIPLTCEGSRARVIELAEKILAMTIDPETNLLVKSLQYHFCTCLKIAVDLDIAKHIPRLDRVTAGELAVATGADEKLLVRVMRVLTTNGVFYESPLNVYGHTAMSWVMCKPGQKHLLTHRLDEGFRSSSRMAEALRIGGYREPGLGDSCGFNVAFQTDANFWTYVGSTDPMRGKNFDVAVEVAANNDLNIVPLLFPFDTLSKSGGTIVDVGGGLGHVGRQILAHYSNSDLRCIVQDQSTANDRYEKKTSDVQITFQQHNFFDRQPVNGAAAYLLRHILHDWPDNACKDILKQIVPAMDKDHSRILICDQVMDDNSPSQPSILYDIDMMSLFGGKERRLCEWQALITETDSRLHITNLRKSPSSSSTMMEVRIA